MVEFDLKILAEKFQISEEKMKKMIQKLINERLVIQNGEMYSLTETGQDFMRFIRDGLNET
jgi:predicted transcriptional regulator